MYSHLTRPSWVGEPDYTMNLVPCTLYNCEMIQDWWSVETITFRNHLPNQSWIQHLSSCRPKGLSAGRPEIEKKWKKPKLVHLQLGPDYLYQITPSPPNLSDLLPGFVGFAACIVACMRLSDERSVSKKKKSPIKAESRRPQTKLWLMLDFA